MMLNAFTCLESTQCRFSGSRAFTRVELVVSVAALLLGGAVVLPLLANTGSHSAQVGCLSNLRQIGIAFQAWGTDHHDHRPWFVRVNEGGTAGHVFQNNAFIHYSPLSNYISPAVLVDPAEPGNAKRVAQNWGIGEGGYLNPGFCNNALSYMLSVHTTITETHNILVGDRYARFAEPSGCSYLPGGAAVIRLGGRENFRGWTNGPHGLAGNLLINDGRVEFATQQRFRELVVHPNDLSTDDHVMTP
jgi:hypothetical protein